VPASNTSYDFLYQDKVLHFGCYFVFSVVLYLYSMGHKLRYKLIELRFLFVVGCGSFVGCFLEIVQANFTQNRMGEWTDVCMNTIGLISAFLMMESLKRKSVL
jgi:VanZ family protein